MERNPHLARRQRADFWHDFGCRLDHHRTTHAMKTGFHHRIPQRRAMDCHRIHRTPKTGRSKATLRRADPNRIVIDDRRFLRRSSHVPRPFLRHAIEPRMQTLRLTEAVTHRHMMPAALRVETRFSRPAMPVGGRFFHAAGRHRREQEIHTRQPSALTQPESPVLIVRSNPSRSCASFADDIQRRSALHLIQAHPPLQRDRVTVGKIQPTVGTGIMDHKPCPIAAEFHRRVARLKIWKLRWPRPRRIALHIPLRHQFRCVFRPEVPPHDRRRVLSSERCQRREQQGGDECEGGFHKW